METGGEHQCSQNQVAWQIRPEAEKEGHHDKESLHRYRVTSSGSNIFS